MEKNKDSIEDYLNKKGLRIGRDKDNFLIDCLFCDDKKQHLSIKKSDGCFRCFKCFEKGSFSDLRKKLGDKPIVLNKKTLKFLSPELVSECHDGLSSEIRDWLNKDRQISNQTIDKFQIGRIYYRGKNWIAIPVTNRNGEFAYFRYRREPNETEDEKYRSPKGASAELYGWEHLNNPETKQIIICEGELDKLLLEDKGFSAISGTCGAGTFNEEWVQYFKHIPEIYICYDFDSEGRSGARKVARLIPNSKIVYLPKEVGDGGDVTDFFVKLGKSVDDFKKLLEEAKPFYRRFIKCFIEPEDHELIGVLGEKDYTMLRIIAGFMDESGIAIVGQDKIAEILKMDLKTVNRKIGKLKEKTYEGRKLLTIEKVEGAKGKWDHNQYFIDPVAGFQYGNNPEYITPIEINANTEKCLKNKPE